MGSPLGCGSAARSLTGDSCLLPCASQWPSRPLQRQPNTKYTPLPRCGLDLDRPIKQLSPADNIGDPYSFAMTTHVKAHPIIRYGKHNIRPFDRQTDQPPRRFGVFDDVVQLFLYHTEKSQLASIFDLLFGNILQVQFHGQVFFDKTHVIDNILYRLDQPYLPKTGCYQRLGDLSDLVDGLTDEFSTTFEQFLPHILVRHRRIDIQITCAKDLV